MTPDEIQALREKHQPMPAYWPKYCAGCATEQYWQGVAYPCDVIQVLDAWEAERKVQACDHLMPDPITGKPTPANEWGHIFCPYASSTLKDLWEFTYCPKCGEKL